MLGYLILAAFFVGIWQGFQNCKTIPCTVEIETDDRASDYGILAVAMLNEMGYSKRDAQKLVKEAQVSDPDMDDDAIVEHVLDAVEI